MIDSRNLFAGKVALVTGAGGGIGRALTRRLCEMGYRPALVGRNADKLKDAAAAAGAGDALLLAGDLTDPAFLQGVIARVVEKMGGLDLLVNNAGICFVQDMEKTAYADFDRMMKTNVYAPYILCRDAIAPLKQSACATIVNIGSVVSHKGYATQSAYTAAKHALLGLTKALGAEVYDQGIRVHMLSPGMVNTEMARIAIRPDVDPETLIDPSELADALEYLLIHRQGAAVDEIRLHRAGKQPF